MLNAKAEHAIFREILVFLCRVVKLRILVATRLVPRYLYCQDHLYQGITAPLGEGTDPEMWVLRELVPNVPLAGDPAAVPSHEP